MAGPGSLGLCHSRGGPTSGCGQHVREPLPSSHHLWVLFQICEVLPDSDGTIILGREGQEVRTQAWLLGHTEEGPG